MDNPLLLKISFSRNKHNLRLDYSVIQKIKIDQRKINTRNMLKTAASIEMKQMK